jgi:transcriptional regulator with XRE-family HTH domain
MTQLGKRLRWLRRDKDLTQEKVAQLTGVQARSLRDWEAGKHMPSIDALGKLATLYGVSVDSLVVQAVAALPQDDAVREEAIHGSRVPDHPWADVLDIEEYAALMQAGDLGGVELV